MSNVEGGEKGLAAIRQPSNSDDAYIEIHSVNKSFRKLTAFLYAFLSLSLLLHRSGGVLRREVLFLEILNFLTAPSNNYVLRITP